MRSPCLFVLAVAAIVAPACGVPGLTGSSGPDPAVVGSDSPQRVVGGLSFRAIGTGNGVTCALTSDGEAWCWGFNERGELGTGATITVTRDSTPNISRPVQVVGGHRFAALAVGDHHSCGLSAEGETWCWGDNISGALGTATTQQCVHWFNGNWPCSSTPVRAQGPPLVAIAAGDGFTCGIDWEGRAWCWGANGSGQLGDGTEVTRERPGPVSGGARFSAVAAGRLRQTCGVTIGGDVYCWGSGVGFGPRTARPSLLPAPAAEGGTFAAVTAVWNHTCALDRSGAAWCWGNNNFGQIGDGSAETRLQAVRVTGGHDFVALTSGEEHTCGITTQNEALCWGSGFLGTTGGGASQTCLSIPSTGGTLNVPCAYVPTPVQGGPRFAVLSASGALHSCGVSVDGSAYCWGNNAYGQLGIGRP